jgi:hypothetical protein
VYTKENKLSIFAIRVKDDEVWTQITLICHTCIPTRGR